MTFSSSQGQPFSTSQFKIPIYLAKLDVKLFHGKDNSGRCKCPYFAAYIFIQRTNQGYQMEAALAQKQTETGSSISIDEFAC